MARASGVVGALPNYFDMKVGTTATLNRLTTASRAKYNKTNYPHPNYNPHIFNPKSFPIKDLIHQFESSPYYPKVKSTLSSSIAPSTTSTYLTSNTSTTTTKHPSTSHTASQLHPHHQQQNADFALHRGARERSSSLELILGPMLTSTRTRL